MSTKIDIVLADGGPGHANTERLSEFGFPEGPNGATGKLFTNNASTTSTFVIDALVESDSAAWQAYWGLSGFDPQFGGNKDMDDFNPGNLDDAGIPGSTDPMQRGQWVPTGDPPVKGPPISAYMPLLKVPEDPEGFELSDLSAATRFTLLDNAMAIGSAASYENRLSPQKSISVMHANAAYDKDSNALGKYQLGKSSYTAAAAPGITPEQSSDGSGDA